MAVTFGLLGGRVLWTGPGRTAAGDALGAGLRDLGVGRAGGSHLDVSVGGGEVLDLTADRGSEWVCVDPDPAALAVVKAKHPGVWTAIGGLDDLDRLARTIELASPAPFDTITCLHPDGVGRFGALVEVLARFARPDTPIVVTCTRADLRALPGPVRVLAAGDRARFRLLSLARRTVVAAVRAGNITIGGSQ